MSKQNLDELIEASEEAIEKGEDLSEIEADHKGKVKEKQKDQKGKVTEKIRDSRFKTEKAVHEEVEETVDETAEAVEGSDEEVKKSKAKKKKSKAKIRSKKYQEAKVQIEPKERYELDKAIELVKKTSTTKFDGNIELHVRLLAKSGKPEQVRGLIKYPFSTGKKVSVVILDEKMIDEIASSGKADFDIALATPALMSKVAKLAKILGPKGKMPNPKAGTITADPEKTKAELEGGQTEYKTDSYGIIHQVIGKVSAKTEELEENFKTIMAVLPTEKIKSINLCATMGPSVKVQK